MSDCGVCIGGYDEGYSYDFFNREHRKARKEHKCCECRRIIFVGETYVHDRGKFDGDIFTAKTCSHCTEIRSGFTCETSSAYGELWAEMKEKVITPLTNPSPD